MARKHGPWTIKETHRRYRNEWIEVCEDEVTKPDGRPGTYATIKLKDGVEVLALDDDGFVYLAREFRYALGREDTEAVGGTIDDGETPLEAAKRELREEMGIEAEEWAELGRAHHTTSIVDSTTTLFLAQKLRFGEKEEDSTENIKVEKIKLDEAVEMALSDRMTHATSCVLILRVSNYIRR